VPVLEARDLGHVLVGLLGCAAADLL